MSTAAELAELRDFLLKSAADSLQYAVSAREQQRTADEIRHLHNALMYTRAARLLEGRHEGSS